MKNSKISIIIITLNEERFVERLLKQLINVQDIEIIVSDGGSIDRTARVAKSYIDKVIVGERGRGVQLNAGAALATGDILWFLHADSIPPDDFKYHIVKTLEKPGVVGGAFKLKIDSQLSSIKFISNVANLRSLISRIPYGDQSLFIKKEIFQRLNGFKDIPLMEDIEFGRRLKKEGRIECLRNEIKTCARVWEREGVLKTTLRNWVYVTLFFMGYSPHTLYRRYYRRHLYRTMQRENIRKRKGWDRVVQNWKWTNKNKKHKNDSTPENHQEN
jgi:rSAM/selenodomain-associated transferase 2